MLQFQPYGEIYQGVRMEQDQRRGGLDRINQTLQGISGDAMQIAQQRRDAQRQAMLDKYLQQDYERKAQQHAYEFGTPIDPNITSVSPFDQNMSVGRSSFMPGGQGRVAAASPLIEQFNQYRASNYPKDQARPEFMQAMGAKEREMVFERDNPKPPSIFMSDYQRATLGLKEDEVNLKKQEAERKRQEAEAAAQQVQKDQAEKARTISQKIDDALNMVGATTAGFGGSLMGKVPGSGATDLQGVLDTIKANLGFDQLLTLKSGSKNGSSGLGALSENEMRLLTSLSQSLDRSQSPQQLVENLTALKNKYSGFQNALGYNGQGGGSGGKIRVRNRKTGQTGSISEKFFDPNKYERVQ